MNLTSKRVSYTHSVYGGHLKIFTTLTEAQETELNKLYDYANTGGEISIEVKKKSKKRSLDANAYMWVLLHKMADVLNTTKLLRFKHLHYLRNGEANRWRCERVQRVKH
jgi:hypothetical protein